jgi:hypothetical protein
MRSSAMTYDLRQRVKVLRCCQDPWSGSDAAINRKGRANRACGRLQPPALGDVRRWSVLSLLCWFGRCCANKKGRSQSSGFYLTSPIQGCPHGVGRQCTLSAGWLVGWLAGWLVWLCDVPRELADETTTRHQRPTQKTRCVHKQRHDILSSPATSPGVL